MPKTLINLLIKQLYRFFPYYILAIASLCFTHLIQSYLPFYAKELATLVSDGGASIDIKIFFWMALGIIFFRTASRWIFFYPARVMEKDLKVDALKALEESNPYRYQSFSSGQLYQIVLQDFEMIRALVGFMLLQVGNIIIASIVILPKIYNFNSALMPALIPMFLAVLIFTYIINKNGDYYKKTMDQQGEVQNFIIETYRGKKTIKNYQAENAFFKLFEASSLKEIWYFYRAGIVGAISRPLIPLGVGFSLLWGAHIIKVQDLGAPALILFSGFVFLLLEPLMYASWVGIVWVRGRASWKRIRNLMDSIETESDEERRLKSLNYPIKESELDSKFILKFWEKDLEVNVTPSQWTVFVGKTGCGKTEIIKQLSHILAFRNKNISLVTQAPYLYNDSVSANIFLNKVPDEKEKEFAYELLKLFALDYLAASREELFNLEIGEHGKRLSGGQAKRLALVRSIVSEADILIWDDPFSAIDLMMEKMIVSRLKDHPELKNKTIILTTHRFTTVKSSDQIIFLEKLSGVIEEGQTKILLSAGSRTYDYFKSQMV